jgi:hypothetical protein
MTERVDIANICLSMLGEKPITSLDDNSSNAKQLTIQYVPARDATLEAYDWTFAIERFMPGLLTAAPVYGAGQLFAVPSNILRVIACDNVTNTNTYFRDAINSKEQIDWQMEGGNIICNEEVVYARGVRRVEDEGSFSSLFVQAFAAKLAMLLAVNLTASADIQARVTGYYEFAINEAISRDGQQGRSVRFRSRRPNQVR